MQTARRRRRIMAIAASGLAHGALLTVVALQAPRLVIPRESAGPPEPIIPVLIMPRAPPPEPGASRPAETIRLHRRPPRGMAQAPIEPLPVPTPEIAAPAPPQRPTSAFHPAPLPEGPKSDLRAALRRGAPGCANPDAVGLTKAERQVCDEQFGGMARVTPFNGLGLNPDKQSEFDRAAARKAEDRRYRDTMPPPRPHRGPPGSTAEDIGRDVGDDRPALKVPF